MYIEYIESTNFRGIPSFSLNLNKNLNVFIGNNGVGTSSILCFIAIILSQCRTIAKDIILGKISDINNSAHKISGKIRCKHKGSYVLAQYSYSENEISLKYFENTSGDFNDSTEQKGPLSLLYKELEKEVIPFKKNFPLIVSYPTNRGILEIPERIRGFKPAIHPFDAIDNALENNLDFHSFIALFRMNENSSRQQHTDDPYAQWQLKQIQAVNNAISSVVPEFGNLHVTQKPFRISVLKKEKNWSFYNFLMGKGA